jgi:hypothetical protein
MQPSNDNKTQVWQTKKDRFSVYRNTQAKWQTVQLPPHQKKS